MLRTLTRALLLGYVFTVPWQYSMDFGEPWGNITRLIGLAALFTAVTVVMVEGGLRRWRPLQWLILSFIFYWIVSAVWSVDAVTTIEKARSLMQTAMMALLLWEFESGQDDFRLLMRAFTAGSVVLALLTIFNFLDPSAYAADQLRYVAAGQDPNDVARFLDLAFPLAACSARTEQGWLWRLPALAYLPLGLAAVLLTASRGGAVAAAIALLGAIAVLFYQKPRLAFFSAPLLAASFLVFNLVVPQGSLQRIATLRDELLLGTWNDRLAIWSRGLEAFHLAPWFGQGAGTFVLAAQTANGDTAHNTPLTLLVTGGLIGLGISFAIACEAIRLATQLEGHRRIALLAALAALLVSSLVGTVEENRTTWLVIAFVAVAARLREAIPKQGLCNV